ncbi:MAG: T9SS type A sorting domain-containing protein, partial [Chitinophagaceae bacterium]
MRMNAQLVINAGGSSVAGNAFVLEYSIGEISIRTLTAATDFTTQGLLQPTPKYIGPYCAILSAPMQTFPNPVLDKLRLVGQYDWITSYHIYAVDGMLVRAQPFYNNFLDLTGLPRAIYFVKLFPGCNNTHTVLKVMKQ